MHLNLRSIRLQAALLLATGLGLVACNETLPDLSTQAISAGNYAVEVATTQTWTGGFQGYVRLKNINGDNVTKFKLRFKLNSGTVSSGWGGVFSAADANGFVTVVNPDHLQYNPVAPGGQFDSGFNANGTFAGAQTELLEINGQVVTPGNGNTPPTVSITNPANGATLAAGTTSVTVNATASDANGMVSSVKFYRGATLISTDTTAPYSAVVTGLSAGSFTLKATATDNAGATADSSVTITVASSGGNTPPTVSITSPANGATLPAGTTSVTVNATASDTNGTVSSVKFFNGSTLVATDTTAPYSASVTGLSAGSFTFKATATDNGGATSDSSVTVTVAGTGGGTRLDNPFVGAKWYVNQEWAAKARADGGAAIAGYSTAVWMDRIGAIAPTDSSVMGLRAHLDAALAQGANVFQVVVYDLPNRDCFALASNGELRISQNGFNRYKNEYITPLAAILADPKYKSIRIIAIIEPDSLPNLVTNISDPDCQEAAGPGGYVEATQFTLNTLYPITNVYSYVDIGHSGWLGWDDNLSKATTLIGNAIKGTTNGVNSIAGFVSNTANTTPTTEPFLDAYANAALPGSNGGTQVRQAKFYEWNPIFSEKSFVTAWRAKMISLGFPATIGMLVDTSRNGWGGPNRPTKLSTSTNVDTFVNESRIDRRTHRGMWCNQASGIGERPTVAPAPGIDAYVWVKPPGESDGVATAGIIDPTDPAKGFDRFCDPTYVVPAVGFITGALPNAPHAGRWFTEGFKILLRNAYPPL
jgi:cellulose 1,4-beta-cellobiosidase